MKKKILAIILFILSLCGCSSFKNYDNFYNSLLEFKEYYESQEFHVFKESTNVINENNTIVSDNLVNYFKSSNNEYIHFYSDIKYPTIIKLKDNYYYKYVSTDNGVIESKLTDKEQNLYFNNKSLFTSEKYKSYCDIKFLKYTFDIKYNKLENSDKDAIKEILDNELQFINFNYSINNVNFYYEIFDKYLLFDLKINISFLEDYSSVEPFNDLFTKNIVVNKNIKFSCDEFKLLEPKINVENIDDIKFDTDMFSNFTLFSGGNFFRTILSKGLYELVDSNDYSLSYRGNVIVDLYNSSKAPIERNIDLMKNDIPWKTAFFITVDDYYYINIQLPDIIHDVRLRKVEIDTFPKYENVAFTSTSGTILNYLDFDTFTLTLNEISIVKIENTGLCNLNLYCLNGVLDVRKADTQYFLFNAGEYTIGVYGNNNLLDINYPYEYSFIVEIIKLDKHYLGDSYEDPEFTYKLKEEYEQSIYLGMYGEKYLILETLEEGYYKVSYDLINNFSDEEYSINMKYRELYSNPNIYYDFYDNYAYLKANTKYCIVVDAPLSEVKFKYECFNENIFEIDVKLYEDGDNDSKYVDNLKEQPYDIVKYYFTLDDIETLVYAKYVDIYDMNGNKLTDAQDYQDNITHYSIKLDSGKYYFMYIKTKDIEDKIKIYIL